MQGTNNNQGTSNNQVTSNQGISNQGTNKPPVKLPKNWREMSKNQLAQELMMMGVTLVLPKITPKIMVKYAGEVDFVELKDIAEEEDSVI